MNGPGSGEGPELPVAGVAKARHNVAAFVQVRVERRDVDVDVRVRTAERRHASGGRNERDLPSSAAPLGRSHVLARSMYRFSSRDTW